MKRTAKGKFEGGDAAWEEEKLGNYATSEIRLVEIQETVCSEVEEGRDQCYTFHEQYDHEIEDWWFNRQTDEPNLYKYFCIKTIKHCCPDLHYGENCTPCEGYPDSVCNNNGKCKGAGTRKGNGKCSCDLGYGGDKCNKCAENYFEAYKDEKKLLCSKCHISCDGSCTSAGPTGKLTYHKVAVLFAQFAFGCRLPIVCSRLDSGRRKRVQGHKRMCCCKVSL